MEKREFLNKIKEFRDLKLHETLDYNKLYLYSIITHSTAIEGSTITEIENQNLFDKNLQPKNKTEKEILMNTDLKNAYERGFEICKQKTPFSIVLLSELSGLLMKNNGSKYNTIFGEFDSSKGNLRRINVRAGKDGKHYMDFHKVPEKLKIVCDELNKYRLEYSKEKDIYNLYRLSFYAHYSIATIHPWADGNGRMSRLVMNLIQYENNIPPTIVKKENRSEYIAALDLAQNKDDPYIFYNFMFKEHFDNIQKEIDNYKNSTDKEYNLKFDDFDSEVNEKKIFYFNPKSHR